jgi:hypothetical protein
MSRYRRTTIKKYRSGRKGRRSFDTAIEYNTVAMMASEKRWTAIPAVRASSPCDPEKEERMDGLEYVQDSRSVEPNETGYRRARFQSGWADAAGGLSYEAKTLETLTWQNLGYRLGKVLGKTSSQLVDDFYYLCVRQQAETL